MQTNPHIGKLVTSLENDLGIGKIIDSNRETAVIEYFDSPASAERPTRKVAMSSVRRVKKLGEQTRVYFFDVEAGYWRIGRVHQHVDQAEIFIDLPNEGQARLSEREIHVRWNRPLSPLKKAFMDDRDNYYTPTKAYTALRIPQVGENAKLKRLILSGVIDFAEARKLETACLGAVFSYERGNGHVEEVIDILASYERLWRGGVVSIDRIRETLVDAPWRSCRCQVCRELGINVVIFRGAERNRRRGFHNLYVLREMLASI